MTPEENKDYDFKSLLFVAKEYKKLSRHFFELDCPREAEYWNDLYIAKEKEINTFPKSNYREFLKGKNDLDIEYN